MSENTTIYFQRGGITQGVRDFDLNQAGVPLEQVIAPIVSGMSEYDLFIRTQNGEIMLTEHERQSMSFIEALRRASGDGNIEGMTFIVDATVEHKGA